MKKLVSGSFGLITFLLLCCCFVNVDIVNANNVEVKDSVTTKRHLRVQLDEDSVATLLDGGYAEEVSEILRDPNLKNIDLNQPEGKRLFSKLLSLEKDPQNPTNHVLDLLMSLETQMNMGACAPASAVTVLNAMDYKKPYDPTYTSYVSEAYAFWTQTAFVYEPCVRKILSSRVFGETLEGLGSVMKCLGLNVEVRHSDGSDTFANSLKKHFDDNHYVIANFERAAIHEKAGGHFSPLGGYVDDYMLILDVARYKYPPTFVPLKDLVSAMARVDLQSGMARGYIALWRKK